MLHQSDIAQSIPRCTLTGSARARRTLTSQCSASAPYTGTSKCESMPGQLCVPLSSKPFKNKDAKPLMRIEPATVRLRSACSANWAVEVHGASVRTTARRIHPCGKNVASATADLATACGAGSRVFPNSWHTVPKHTDKNTDALHRTAENRLQGDASPRGQNRMEWIPGPAGRARWICSPSPPPSGHFATAARTQLPTAVITGTHRCQGSWPV